jgi:hypothetical protein
LQLQRISSLYLKDNVIIGEIESKPSCINCGGRGVFKLDVAEGGDKTTKELVY